MDVEYKAICQSYAYSKEILNVQNDDYLLNQNDVDIDSVLNNLSDCIENKSQDGILSALMILKQNKKLDFTLQLVKHHQLFEKLIWLGKLPNEEIQFHSIAVINLALNWETIEYSMESSIISFLIDVINANNKSAGFIAIQSLSKIASHCCYCHDKVIFHLASLDVLHDCPFISEMDDITENVYNVTEYVEIKCRSGKKRYIPYQTPGILPENDDNFETEIEKVHSFENLLNYIQFNEDGKDFICIPSLKLISSLLKFELNPAIISFCLETLISLIPISNEPTLIIILNALCLLSKQKIILWNETFQMTNPASWLAPLFQSEFFEKSVKIAQLLMFFISNVIKQGVIIEGLPFDLLINNLQYQDDKFIVATYAAASIDSMLKIHNSLINTFIQIDLLKITSYVFDNLSFSAKALIVSYLTRICQYGSAKHKRIIIEMNMVSFLVEILLIEFANEDLLLRIFLSLIGVFECAESNTNDIKSCYDQIADSVTQIRQFQFHEKQSISNIARKFVIRFLDKSDDNEYDDDDDSPLFCF